MKRIDLIRKALKHYPGLKYITKIKKEWNKLSEDELLAAADDLRFGDTLLSFIVLELADADGDTAEGLRMLDRAITDLQAVRNGLYKDLV